MHEPGAARAHRRQRVPSRPKSLRKRCGPGDCAQARRHGVPEIQSVPDDVIGENTIVGLRLNGGANGNSLTNGLSGH